MKYACSLEMVNMLTSGPGAFTRQSKNFWTDYMKYAAAVGFTGIELPFNCYSSDAMAFETGRSGIPCSELAIAEKYNGYDAFAGFLKEIGIADGVVDIHVSAQDAMLELLASGKEAEEYFSLAEKLFLAALVHAEKLRAKFLIVSPSPELGWLNRVFGEDLHEFEEKTAAILTKLTVKAGEAGIAVAVKNEFWSYFRGDKMADLLARVPGLRFSPDPAHLYIEDGTGDSSLLNCVRKRVGESSCDSLIICARVNDTSFRDTAGNRERINAEIPVEGPQKVFSDCGEGKIDLKGLVRGLRNSGYDGWLICENRKTLDVYKGLLKLGWFVQHELKSI